MLRTNRLRSTLISNTVPRLFLLLPLSAYSPTLASYLRFLYAGQTLAGRLPATVLPLGLALPYSALLERSRRLLASARVGPPRTHEPVQRPHRPRVHRRRHRSGFHLGGPPHGAVWVLRPQVRRHAARAPALRRLLAALAHQQLARSPCLAPKHFQFRRSNFEFHGGQSLSVAQPPLFLAVPRNANGNRPRRPKSSYRTARSARARLLHPRPTAHRCRHTTSPLPSPRHPPPPSLPPTPPPS